MDLFAPLGAAKFESEWVEFPEYTPACYEEKKYNCGKPHGEIWKYAWAGMKAKWPQAYNVAKNYAFDTKELGLLGGEVDVQGKTIEDVAAAWVQANEATWRPWVTTPAN